MNIVEQKENKLLKRKEIQAQVHEDGVTPTRQAMRKELAKKLKTKEDLIIIKKMHSIFGGGIVDLSANVYEDRETLEKVTLKHLLERNKMAEEPVSEEAEAPAEAPVEASEEAPAEESTEEEKKEA